MSQSQDFVHPYVDPGVYVSEIPYPTVTNPTLTPTIIGLVGEGQGYRKGSEVLPAGLTGTTAYQLAQLGIDISTIQVSNYSPDPATYGTVYAADLPRGLTPTTTNDFRIRTQGSGAQATTTIERESGGTLPADTPLLVTYQYTDPTYFDILHFTDYDDVRDVYGEPYDASGAIHSKLTLGAKFAFQNGAVAVVLVPVQPTTPGQPPTTTDWTNAIAKLGGEPEVNVVVPLDGTTGIHDIARQHVVAMEAQGILRLAFIGRDGSTVTPQQLITEAVSHGSSRVVLVGPTQFQTFNGVVTDFVIGGQFAAAAAAGSFASRPVQEPLTHRQIFGFSGIVSQGLQNDILSMQKNGVCVLYERRDKVIYVKHGLTTKTASSVGGDRYTQEISVQAARDRLRDLIQETLEDSELVGGIINADTPDLVLGTITGALEIALDAELIQDYQDVKFRIPADSPTLVEIRFSYSPSMPLNYVNVQFALNTQTGEVNFSDTTTGDVTDNGTIDTSVGA